MKKNRTILSFIVIMLVAALAWIIFKVNAVSNTSVVAYINQEPVTVSELSQALARKRADVYAYFHQKYNAADSPEFWTKSFQGEVPLEKIKKDALDDIVKIKVQQILAKEKGLLKDISYEKFIKDLKAENIRRKEALKNNQVIYGPEQYSEAVYFDITFSNLVGNLKDRLHSEMWFDQKEIENFYKNNIDLYTKSDTIKVKRISADYADNDAIKPTAEKIVKEIKDKLQGGADFVSVSRTVPSDPAILIEIAEQTFDPETAKSDYMLWRDLIDSAKTLSAGKVSEVIDFNGAFYLLYCFQRTEGGVLTLEEARESIERQFSENAYGETVAKMAETARVDIIGDVYERIDERYVR